MEIENVETPVPNWTVCKKDDPNPLTGKNIEQQTRTKYYWTLNRDTGFLIPRFYPINYPDGGLDWCFIPERYWYNMDTTTYSKSSFDWSIDDARGFNGEMITVKTGKAELKKKLLSGQKLFGTTGLKNNSFITGPDHVETTDGRYVTFHKETPPAKCYVRLRDKDVMAMTTGDRRYQPEEIYMDSILIERFINGEDGCSRWEFEIRTGDGQGRIFEMDQKVCVTAKEWTARRDRAINSLDKDGGWNRMINPNLKLFLVPVSPEFNLQKIVDLVLVNWTKKSPKCEQTCEVLTREVLDKEHAGKLQKIAVSPFNDYETWIDLTVFKTGRGDREMPKDKETLSKLSALVENVPQHTTAEKQRQKVQEALNQPEGDRITIVVSADKIRQARGTRGDVLSQKEVMGSISATDIALGLNWTEARERIRRFGKWPATGVFPAEWLHRCAFSWGGLGNPGNIHSSQLRENLVFGTSECNSVMTRYEKSWQRLTTLQAKLGEPKQLWSLISTTKRYTIGGDVSNPKPHLDNVRWMITELEYTMHVPGCKLLGPNNESLRTTFYPFERGFFTLLEQRIDSAILDKRFKDYTSIKGIEVDLPDIHPDDEVTFQYIDDIDDDLKPIDGGGKKTVVKSPRPPGGNQGQTKPVSNNMIEEKQWQPGYGNTHGPQPEVWGRNSIYYNFNNPITGKNFFESTEFRGDSTQPKKQSYVSPTTLHNQYGDIGGQEGPGSNSDPNIFNHYISKENPYSNKGGQQHEGNSTTVVNTRGTGIDSRNSFPSSENRMGNQDHRPFIRHSMPVSSPASEYLSITGDEKIPLRDTPAASHVNPRSIESKDSIARVQGRASDSRFLSFWTDAVPQVTPKKPTEYVSKAGFTLFGHIPAELHMLQTPSATAGVHQRVSLPGILTLGTLLPTLAGSPLDAIMLTNTTLTYRSKPTLTLPAGLTLATTIQLSGFLDPVNTILHDVFHQKVPRIDVSGLISTNPDCLKRAPAPSGFTLCGELPEVRIELFGVLELTHLAVSIMGRRISSAGGYDYAYGFDGRGRIANIDLDFSMRKDHENYQVLLAMSGEIWKNVGGVVGVNLENVQFEAEWQGTDISSVQLELKATFKLRTASMLLRGLYSKTNYQLSGTLHNADLTMLQHLYEDIFRTTVNTTTEHTVTFSTLSFLVSKTTGITLSGAVTVNGHTSAEATIALSTAGIHITGSVEAVTIPGGIATVESASLDLTIGRDNFMVKLAGCVTVHELNFEVTVYMNKAAGNKLEYTLYGSYTGDMYLRNVVHALEGTFLDVSLQKVAVIVSNMDTPVAEMNENVFAYPIKKGLQIYAEATGLDAVSQLLRLEDTKPIKICASYTPGTGSKAGSFGLALTLPTTDSINFHCMKSGAITLQVLIVGNVPHIAITADIYIAIANRKDPLTLQLALEATESGAIGTASMIGMWNNPFNMGPNLSFGDLVVGVGIEYATFFASGTPNSLTLGGSFLLGPTAGTMLLFLTNNPMKQLVSIEFSNLDVAGLIRLLAELVGCILTLASGSETLFFRILTVYISTGVVIKGVDYPPGIRFNTDMVIFGKNAVLSAVLSSEKVVVKGHIHEFKLGELVVSGATQSDPSIDIEFSSVVQRLHIDGAVRIGESKIYIDVHVEFAPAKTFHFDIVVTFVDSFKLEVKGTLEGAPSQNMDGREFNMSATMEQNLVEYIVDVANKHFETEGDLNRCSILKTEAFQALEHYQSALARYELKEGECDRAVRVVEGEQEKTVQTLRKKMIAAEEKLLVFRVAKETEERELKARIERERGEQQELERMKTSGLVLSVERLVVAESDLERFAVEILERERRMATVMDGRRIATDELSRFEQQCAADLAKEPLTSDPAHTVWEWARRELMRQLEQKRAAVLKANDDHDATGAMLKSYDSFNIAEDRRVLKENMINAKDALRKQQETAKPRRASSSQHAIDELRTFRINRDKELAVLLKDLHSIQQKETIFIASAKFLVEVARTKNNIEDTIEHEEMVKTRRIKEETDMEYRSFDNLLHIINVWGAIQTVSMRYTRKLVAGKFLKIDKILVTGKLSNMAKNKGSLSAKVYAVIGFVSVTLDVTFEIDNILSFFTSLWMAIGSVMDQVAGTMKYVLDEGKKAIGDLIKDVAAGVQIGLVEGKKFVQDVDKTLGHPIEEIVDTADEFRKDVGHTVDRATDEADELSKDVGHTVEVVVDKAEQVRKDVTNTLDHSLEEAKLIGQNLIDSTHNASKGPDVFEKQFTDIRDSISRFRPWN